MKGTEMNKETTDMVRAIKREYLRNEIEHKAIYRCKPGETIPGKIANTKYIWQFYLRRCMYDPKFIMTAAELLVEQLPSTYVQIGACEDAGVSLGMAMSLVLGKPMLSIKKERKVYGLYNFSEGPVLGLPILLVDDLAGSQTTLRNSRRVLEAFEIPVAKQYATLINKTQGTHDAYLKDKDLISLFTCDDFAMTWQQYVDKYGYEPKFGHHF
jgi:adenine/guanine phosphoribosyltransferase-like PRPP-binding protein